MVLGAQDSQPIWADALSGFSAAESWAATGIGLADSDVPLCTCPLCSGQESAFSESDSIVDGPTSGLPPSISLSQIITQLRTSWGGTFEGDTYPVYGSSISYAILTSAPNDHSNENSGWQAMTALMVVRATEAFEAWDDFIAIGLSPYSGNPPSGAAVIQFGYSSASQGGGTYERPELGYYNGTNEFGGDHWSITRSEIWLNSSWSTHSASSAINQSGYGYYGGYGLITYLHEIGHALGLSHPGSYNAGSGTPTYQNSAEYLEDTRRYSIMSYWNAYEDGSGTDHWGSDGALKYAQTPMVHDIVAAQLVYGADPTTRTGNTTYGFNSTAGKDVYDFTKNLNPILSIYDAAGIDTLDLSGFSGTQRIDLTPGAYSDVGGYMTNNLGIAYSATIENAVGGSGNDMIVGNSAANMLRGGAGSDALNGGSGSDTASYETSPAVSWGSGFGSINPQPNGVLVDLYTNQNSFGHATGDVLTSIESLLGSAFNDFLLGDLAANILDGGDGNDFIFGRFSADVIRGGAGNDVLFGDDASGFPEGTPGIDYGADQIFGGAGNDDLYGEGGADMISGGADTDLLNYSTSPFGISVDLVQQQGFGPEGSYAHGDTYALDTATGRSDIENVRGSNYDDIIIGNTGDNVLEGMGGNDLLIGSVGVDVLAGGAGRDSFVISSISERGDIIVDFDSVAGEIIDLRSLFEAHGLSTADPFGDGILEIEGLSGGTTHTTISIDLDGAAGQQYHLTTLYTLLDVDPNSLIPDHHVIWDWHL